MAYIFLLSIYLIAANKFRKSKIVLWLLSIQIISVCSILLIYSSNFSDLGIDALLFIPIIAFLTLSIIVPWKSYDNIEFIKVANVRMLKSITNCLLLLSAYVFIILSIVAAIVLLTVDDINSFKYIDGSSDFYATMLPFPQRFYNIARVFYRYSFVLFPLHFYFQAIGEKRYSRLCLFFTTNIIIYGLAFFSRWTIMLYILMYFSYWIIFRKITPKEERKKEKKFIYIIIGAICAFFVFVTLSRFAGDSKMASNYEAKIPEDSKIQDPSLYSIFDYLGKSNYYGTKLITEYDGRTFGGLYIKSEIDQFLSIFGLADPMAYQRIYDKLWTGDYQGTFTGFVAYTVYDLGFIGAFIFCLLYYSLVKLKNRQISIYKLLLSSATLQLPVCSIFYSQASGVVMCLFLYLPLFFMLKISERRL